MGKDYVIRKEDYKYSAVIFLEDVLLLRFTTITKDGQG